MGSKRAPLPCCPTPMAPGTTLSLSSPFWLCWVDTESRMRLEGDVNQGWEGCFSPDCPVLRLSKDSLKPGQADLVLLNQVHLLDMQHVRCWDAEVCSSYCCSAAKSCLNLCNPMDCSTSGFPVLHCLLEFAQTGPLSQWCHPTISFPVIPFSSCPQSFPESGSFPVRQLFASGGQSIGASASATILQMNIQSWFPLGLTGLISLQSTGLWRGLSNTTMWKHSLWHSFL